MAVADAFKFPIVGNLAGLAIDATALYALSAPDVPQSIRDAAIERAGIADRLKAEAARREMR
jgi:hypothetical protein